MPYLLILLCLAKSLICLARISFWHQVFLDMKPTYLISSLLKLLLQCAHLCFKLQLFLKDSCCLSFHLNTKISLLIQI